MSDTLDTEKNTPAGTPQAPAQPNAEGATTDGNAAANAVAAESKSAAKAAKAVKKEEKKAQKRKNKEYKIKLFPANKKGKHYCHLMNLLRVMFFPLHWLLFPFKMYGFKKVPAGAYVYVGNHYCQWDAFYPAHTTWEVLHYMAKQSLLENALLKPFARGCGVIGAMRDGADVRTVVDSMKVLKNGEKLVIFPEGTRNKKSDEEFLPFHGGAALLAIKTKTPVLPFVICNRPKLFRMTHVVFGEPFEFSEYYGRKLTQADYDEADRKLVEHLYALRDKHRAEMAEKKNKKRK